MFAVTRQLCSSSDKTERKCVRRVMTSSSGLQPDYVACTVSIRLLWRLGSCISIRTVFSRKFVCRIKIGIGMG